MHQLGIIAAQLYDKEHVGAFVLRNQLSLGQREELIAEIGSPALYQKAPKKYYNAEQDFNYFFVEKTDDFPSIKILQEQFRKLSAILGQYAGYIPQPNNISVHHYPKGSAGITPHRDEKFFKNLIGVYVVKGHAPFYVGKEQKDLEVHEGDLILLRAPRYEKDLPRPIHAVGTATKDRYSIMIREFHG